MNSYKWIYLLLILFLASCNNKGSNKEFPTELVSKKVNISKFQEDTTFNDTTYKFGSYLICAKKGIKIEIINKKHIANKRITKGDTLYNDKDTIILGDFNGMTKAPASKNFCLGDSSAYEGVYKIYYSKYNFTMFQVNEVYHGKLAQPDFKTDSFARYYKRMISRDYGKKNDNVNFAGHYTIIELKKQGMSHFLAVIDRINGKVYHKFPFGIFDWFYDTEYNKKSRMIIINSDFLNFYPGYSLLRDDKSNDILNNQPAIYVWNDSIFKKLE